MTQNMAIVILAAGASSRMGDGRDKLLEPIRGTALLRHIQDRALATHAQVVLCLPDPAHPRCSVLAEPGQRVFIPDATDGMSASIRGAIRALDASVSSVMILPGDMPELTEEDLLRVLQAHDGRAITRGASQSGVPGHPVVFPRACFAALLRLTGDEGARSVLKTHPGGVTTVLLPEDHALVDLDTPQAWEDWRSKTGVFS
ncbi:MAG: nucleotidyltransferase family protein [Thalassovita sp.]